MGIKPSYIKNLGEELIVKHRDRFTGDFDENKHAVAEVAVIDSKGVRNRVAGYISRQLNTGKR